MFRILRGPTPGVVLGLGFLGDDVNLEYLCLVNLPSQC